MLNYDYGLSHASFFRNFETETILGWYANDDILASPVLCFPSAVW